MDLETIITCRSINILQPIVEDKRHVIRRKNTISRRFASIGFHMEKKCRKRYIKGSQTHLDVYSMLCPPLTKIPLVCLSSGPVHFEDIFASFTSVLKF
jgi:hypothetical protein